MAKNPMQRKAQNSFLLGMLITLLVTGTIIGVLILQLTKITKEQQEELANLKEVYVVAEEIKSGDSVTEEKLQTKKVDITTVPDNVLSLEELYDMSQEFDQNGNLIKKYNVISKINLMPGTIITSDMIKVEGELADDVRKTEYNVIVLPSQLASGQYIDIRLRLPSGENLIVLSHKQVEIPSIDGTDSLDTIWMNLSETEILVLSCAIIESYKMDGSYLYATEYIEPGLQEAATATYIPNDATLKLINEDPNCVKEAKEELFKRNNDSDVKDAVRKPINNSMSQSNVSSEDEEGGSGVSGKVQEEISKTQEERQKYLESLGGSYSSSEEEEEEE